MKLNINLYREDVKHFEECLRPITPQRRYKRIGEGRTAGGHAFRIYLGTDRALR